jgi:hypothetical protein
MTKQHDPHKISVKDTNKILTVTVGMQVFEFQCCKECSLPPRGSFIVVRSYLQSILRLGEVSEMFSRRCTILCNGFIEYKCVISLCCSILKI